MQGLKELTNAISDDTILQSLLPQERVKLRTSHFVRTRIDRNKSRF